MAKMQFYRVICDFDAHGGRVRVNGRIHVELAWTPEEAAQKTTEYLKWWHYTNIKITEVHPESDFEKYTREGALWNGGGVDAAAAGKDKTAVQQLSAKPAAPAEEFTDDLF